MQRYKTGEGRQIKSTTCRCVEKSVTICFYVFSKRKSPHARTNASSEASCGLDSVPQRVSGRLLIPPPYHSILFITRALYLHYTPYNNVSVLESFALCWRPKSRYEIVSVTCFPSRARSRPAARRTQMRECVAVREGERRPACQAITLYLFVY